MKTRAECGVAHLSNPLSHLSQICRRKQPPQEMGSRAGDANGGRNMRKLTPQQRQPQQVRQLQQQRQKQQRQKQQQQIQNAGVQQGRRRPLRRRRSS